MLFKGSGTQGKTSTVTEGMRQTLKYTALEAATAPSCLITPCPFPLCCSWLSEQHCSISIRWSLLPCLRPLCLWKWYSTGMPPACQDVTVFPHRLYLCACSSVLVHECLWSGEVGGCHNWLTTFVYNHGECIWDCVSFEVKLCASACEISIFTAFLFVWICYCYFCMSCDWDVDCVKMLLLPFVPNPTP